MTEYFSVSDDLRQYIRYRIGVNHQTYDPKITEKTQSRFDSAQLDVIWPIDNNKNQGRSNYM